MASSSSSMTNEKSMPERLLEIMRSDIKIEIRRDNKVELPGKHAKEAKDLFEEYVDITHEEAEKWLKNGEPNEETLAELHKRTEKFLTKIELKKKKSEENSPPDVSGKKRKRTEPQPLARSKPKSSTATVLTATQKVSAPPAKKAKVAQPKTEATSQPTGSAPTAALVLSLASVPAIDLPQDLAVSSSSASSSASNFTSNPVSGSAANSPMDLTSDEGLDLTYLQSSSSHLRAFSTFPQNDTNEFLDLDELLPPIKVKKEFP